MTCHGQSCNEDPFDGAYERIGGQVALIHIGKMRAQSLFDSYSKLVADSHEQRMSHLQTIVTPMNAQEKSCVYQYGRAID
jgi:hypothetical protein